MASAFTRFKDRITHAQFIETREGGWRAAMDATDKKIYRGLSVAKMATFAGIGVATIVGGPLMASVAMMVGIVYGGVAGLQALERTLLESEAKNNYSDPLKVWPLLKNTGRYFVRPF